MTASSRIAPNHRTIFLVALLTPLPGPLVYSIGFYLAQNGFEFLEGAVGRLFFGTLIGTFFAYITAAAFYFPLAAIIRSGVLDLKAALLIACIGAPVAIWFFFSAFFMHGEFNWFSLLLLSVAGFSCLIWSLVFVLPRLLS